MYYDDGETQWTGTAPGTVVTLSVTKGMLTSDVTVGSDKIARKLDEVVVLGVQTKPKRVSLKGKTETFSFNSTVSNRQ